MIYNFLHTLSGLLLIICFLVKIIVHYYLDYKHNRSVDFIYSFITPLAYFQKYKNVVATSYVSMKRLCNLLLYCTIVFFILNIIIGIILYIKNAPNSV